MYNHSCYHQPIGYTHHLTTAIGSPCSPPHCLPRHSSYRTLHTPPSCPGFKLPHEPIEAICANNTHMDSIATKELHIPSLPPSLKKATVFAEMQKALISVPVLCDGDMEVSFRKKDMVITDTNQQVVLTGTRDPISKLWLLPIVPKKRKSHGQTTCPPFTY